MYYIYIIENNINNKLYVGKSFNPEKRWKYHQSIAKGGPEIYTDRYHYFHKAIKKYGSENFTLNVIESYNTEEEVFQAEIFWIKYLKDFGVKLYNSTEGGEGPSGFKHSEESKKKMKGPRPSIQGENHPLYGIGHTEETKKKMSIISIGKYIGENNPMFGKTGEQSPVWGRKGDKHPNSKISDENLIILRKELESGQFTQRELAKKYNVSDALISNIKNNKMRK